MKTQAAIQHYGSQTALAAALGISQASVAVWGEIVPPLRQLQLERLTEGALKAAPDVFQTETKRRKVAQ
jgi:DNA-binding transcriptional regulator YdaS (Cro superfamily)